MFLSLVLHVFLLFSTSILSYTPLIFYLPYISSPPTLFVLLVTSSSLFFLLFFPPFSTFLFLFFFFSSALGFLIDAIPYYAIHKHQTVSIYQ